MVVLWHVVIPVVGGQRPWVLWVLLLVAILIVVVLGGIVGSGARGRTGTVLLGLP